MQTIREFQQQTEVGLEGDDEYPVEELRVHVELTRVPDHSGTEVAVTEIIYENDGMC